jgi:hypothetical protein
MPRVLRLIWEQSFSVLFIVVTELYLVFWRKGGGEDGGGGWLRGLKYDVCDNFKQLK